MGFLHDLTIADLERRGERYCLRPPGPRDLEPWDENARSAYDQFAPLAESRKMLFGLINTMRDLRAAGKLEGRDDELKWCLKNYFRIKELIEARLSGWQQKGQPQ